MPEAEEIILQVGEGYGFVFQRGRNDLALFAALGAALTEIQAFEVGIEGYLKILPEKDSEGKHTSSKNPDRFYSQTLGMLIKQFKKHLPDSGIAALLENVREKRNYLVHTILKVYGWPLMSDKDYIRAIKEIEGIRALIESASIEVSRYLAERSLLNLIVVYIDHKTGEITQIV